LRALEAPGGERAARELYRAFGGELYGFALARLRDRGLAEEVVQDVFTRVWQRAEDYQGERGSLRTWLYAITRNAVVDAERRRSRRPRMSLHEPPDVGSDADPIEQALLRWQVQLAFARLTPDHREVLHLAYVEGLKLREIAQRLGLPLGTVKSRVHYAAQGLRLALEELEVLS